MSGGDQLSPFCDSHQNFDLGLGWKEKIRCNAYHDRFLHFCLLIVNIKGGSVLVESVLWISNSSQDEPNHPYFCFLWQRCVSSFSVILSQDWSECFRLCEEVARKPKLFFVSTSTTTSTMQTASMSCDLTYHYHLHREEEENHLLGRDGTRRSSSAVHLQEGSWRRICETRRGELEGEREQGGKVPPLLDHHHLHLHIHLLHNHLHSVKHVVHTGQREHMCIDLNLKITSIFRHVVFVWLICFVTIYFHTCIRI